MLVKRKEEFALREQTTLEPAVLTSPKINRTLRAKCLLLVVVMTVMAMFITVRNEMIISEGYDLVKVKSQTAQLERENERLRLEIAELKSPQRIQRIAVSDLGMIVPEDVYFATMSGN